MNEHWSLWHKGNDTKCNVYNTNLQSVHYELVKVHRVGERQRIEWKEFSVCMVRSDYTVCLVVLKKLLSF